MGRTARLAHSDSQSQRWLWFIVSAQGASSSSCLVFNFKVNLALFSSDITQSFFMAKNDFTEHNLINTSWYFLSLIPKVQPTSFSPTNDDDLPPVVHGKKTMPSSLNIIIVRHNLRQGNPEKLSWFTILRFKIVLVLVLERSRGLSENLLTWRRF